MATEAKALTALPACAHEGFHSATSRYDRRAGLLRFLTVCDCCGAEVREVTRLPYRPRFSGYRNRPLAA
jgi:hypothetical protein